MDPIPASRDSFVRYFTTGNKPKLQNNHEESLETLTHPLIYSKDPKKHPDVLQIPMGYHFQRNFFAFVKDLVK
ncbi:MAG: hypothetical protein ACTSRK_07545 [Promethearchaeota archaeon]